MFPVTKSLLFVSVAQSVRLHEGEILEISQSDSKYAIQYK